MSKYFKNKTLLKEFFSKVGKEKGVLTITKYLSDVLGDSGAFYCHSETKEDLEKDYEWLLSCENISFNRLFMREIYKYSKFC